MVSENLVLLVAGIVLGLGAALVAIWPQVTTPGSGISPGEMALFAGSALLLGLLSIVTVSARLPSFASATRAE